MPAVNDVGEPGAREPHARFDGRELETERLVRVTEVGQPDGKPRASRLLDLQPRPRHRASFRPYTTANGAGIAAVSWWAWARYARLVVSCDERRGGRSTWLGGWSARPGGEATHVGGRTGLGAAGY